MHYHNQTCISCGQPFTEADDIVVCPDCGTPYHRACWKQHGHCINQTLHDAQMSWNEIHKPEPEPEAAVPPPQNQNAQPELSFYGRSLRPDAPMLGLNPDEELDGVTIGELSAYVGNNQMYYLPVFLAMKETGRKLSFNLIGLLCPSIFFASRKLWQPAALCVLLQCLLRIPSVLFNLAEMNQYAYLAEQFSTRGAVFNGLLQLCTIASILLTLCTGIFSNYIYYSHAKRTIRKVRERLAARPVDERYAMLREKGGASGVGVLAICAVWFLIALATITVVQLCL